MTIEIFLGYGEHQRVVFTISNMPSREAPVDRQIRKFDVSDEELTKLASLLIGDLPELVEHSTNG